MGELQKRLANLQGSDKTPPSEGDLRVAAETLRHAATREAEPTRGSLIRVAEFAEEVAPMVEVLRIMAENGTLPTSIPGLL